MRRGQPSRTLGTACLAQPASVRVDHNATDVRLLAVVLLHRLLDEDLSPLHLGPLTAALPDLVNVEEDQDVEERRTGSYSAS